MHRRKTIGVLLTLLFAHCADALEVGQAAPLFQLPALTGTARLEHYRGQTVYLDFWASWCTPCRESFPWMNQLQQRYASQGLQVVAINLDKDRAGALRFLESYPASFPIAFDAEGETPQRYAIKAMPTSVLIDPHGKVLWIHRGFRPTDRQLLEQMIQQHLVLRPSALP